MKIAIVSCVFPPYRGGIGQVAYNHALILSKYNHSVTVLSPDYGQGGLRNPPFKIVKLKPWLKFGNAAFVPELLKELNAYDIVQLHYPFFGGAELIFLSIFLRRKRRYKLFIHYHMDTLNLPLVKRLFSQHSGLIRNFLFSRAHKITCASLDYARNSSLKNILNKYPDKFVEIPFSIDTNKFSPDDKKKSFAKENRIIFIGGLDKAHYYKGLDLLLEAVSKIKNKYSLLIIGDGDLKPFYEKKARSLGISEKARFAGKVSDEEKIRHLQTADLLVLPSINAHEAFGLVLIEAMACGCAVIASDLPGVRRVFHDNEHGFLFKANNRADLLKKLSVAFADKERLVEMGRAARIYAIKKYDRRLEEEKLNSIFK